MAEFAELESEVQILSDEANVMILANILESKKALLLQKRLRELADRAHSAGYWIGSGQMQRAADNLAERFPLPIE